MTNNIFRDEVIGISLGDVVKRLYFDPFSVVFAATIMSLMLYFS